MPRVVVHLREEARVVPIKDDSTVGDLLSTALTRLETVPDDDNPFDLVLACDHRAVLDVHDTVLDVLEVHDGKLEDVVILPRSMRGKRQKVDEAPMLAPPGDDMTDVSDEAGPLEVQWAFPDGTRASARIDPAQTSLAVLADTIASRDSSVSPTVELFDLSGYPLGSSGAKKDLPLIQLGWPASGSARCYAVASSGLRVAVDEPSGTADARVGSVQLFVRGDRTFVVLVELDDTVLTLKMKIKSKQGWPVRQQRLSVNASTLRDDNVTLRAEGVKRESTVHITIAPPPPSQLLTGWRANFATCLYEPVVQQTVAGQAAFYSTLRIVAECMTSAGTKLLGALRRLTAFPPLVASMQALLQRQQISQPQRIALVESLYCLFRQIAPRELPGAVDTDAACTDEDVFSSAQRCWAWILHHASAADETAESKGGEWKRVPLYCGLSHAPGIGVSGGFKTFDEADPDDVLRPPSWWRPDTVKGRPCLRAALLKAIANEETEAESAAAAAAASATTPRRLTLADLEPAYDVMRLVAGHLKEDAAYVWTPEAASVANGPFVGSPAPLEPPTGDAWTRALDEVMKTLDGGMLLVRSPLELKSGSERAPNLCRHPVSGAHLCIFEHRTKATVPAPQLYDPLSGDTLTHDFDQWAAALSDETYDGSGDAAVDVPRVTRPPLEATVVLLDLSSSMTKDGFAPEHLEFDPVDRSRAPGDVLKGDVVRFISGVRPIKANGEALSASLPDNITASVMAIESLDDEQPTTINLPPAGRRAALVRFRHYSKLGPTRVKATDLEVLTGRGAAALIPLSRIDTVKQLFAGFANRSMAYDLPHVIGLTTFGSEVKCERKLTEAFESFKAAVDRVSASGQTKLYDALEAARLELHAFCETLQVAPAQGVIKRVLVLSDGEDNGSQAQAHVVSAALQRDGIVVDAVVIGVPSNSRVIGKELRAITVATGGCAFHPGSINEALRLFETETVLALRRRAVTDAYRPKPVVASASELVAYASGRLGAPEGWEAPPDAHIPEGVREAVSLPSAALNQALLNPNERKTSDGRLKRILRELSAYVKAPHPNFEIFPCEGNVAFWQLLLRGPDGTPYANGVFHLWMQFPAEFPAEAPEVRFLTPIHHCNINSHGKVCHSGAQLGLEDPIICILFAPNRRKSRSRALQSLTATGRRTPRWASSYRACTGCCSPQSLTTLSTRCSRSSTSRIARTTTPLLPSSREARLRRTLRCSSRAFFKTRSVAARATPAICAARSRWSCS